MSNELTHIIIGKATAELNQTVKTHTVLITIPIQVESINGFRYFVVTAFKIIYLRTCFCK